uniref:Uncharacterized protein n=1 Tax=Arundo donax TaxID=35708 RepID=A0A0A9GIX2_ARUDO
MDEQFQDELFLRAWSVLIPFSRHSILQKALSPLEQTIADNQTPWTGPWC